MAKIIEALKRHIWCIFIIAVLLLIVLFLSQSLGDDRRREDIAKHRQELQTILNKEDEKERYKDLKKLAKEVGAGYVNTKIAGISTNPHNKGLARPKYENHITESELVININNALQTETMIYMCNIAARNYHIAVWAAIAAAVSALAAWWANVKKRKSKVDSKQITMA